MPGFARARFLLPLSEKLGRATRIADGYVLHDGGRVVEVGPYSDDVGRRLLATHGGNLSVLGRREPAGALSDLACIEGALLPGFVKAHGHDHEPAIIGIVKDVPLTTWLDGAVNPFTRFARDEREALTRELGMPPTLLTYLKARLDDIHYGITTAMVHHCNYSKYFVDEVVAAHEQAGTRATVAIGSQDRHYVAELLDRPEDAVRRLDAAWKEHGAKPRIRIIPGPDQFFSNGPEMLRAEKAWAREHGTLFHIHSAEERNTTAWFREQYGMTEVEYAREVGVLDERTVVAHQVHTTGRDLEILAETRTKVVHNPTANTILGSGMPPIIRMMELGIDVAIATDGSGSSDNQNILAAARLASQFQKAHHMRADYLPAQKVLEMITVDAARMLGVDGGSLEPGGPADFILVDTTRPNLVPTRIANVVENLIWASDGSEVRYVVADGRLLKDDYRFVTLNAPFILDGITRLAAGFDRYRETHAPLKGTGVHR